jgi:hypothetical protein
MLRKKGALSDCIFAMIETKQRRIVFAGQEEEKAETMRMQREMKQKYIDDMRKKNDEVRFFIF